MADSQDCPLHYWGSLFCFNNFHFFVRQSIEFIDQYVDTVFAVIYFRLDTLSLAGQRRQWQVPMKLQQAVNVFDDFCLNFSICIRKPLYEQSDFGIAKSV